MRLRDGVVLLRLCRAYINGGVERLHGGQVHVAVVNGLMRLSRDGSYGLAVGTIHDVAGGGEAEIGVHFLVEKPLIGPPGSS